MVQAVKITSLNDIGTSIMYTTLVPVVNMTGIPTTEKANLQIVGNLILSGAGGSYFPPAAQATVSQFVAYAAQPNITSVGTLTSLAVVGNINAGNANLGNLVIANVFSGTLNGTAVSANTANTVLVNAQPNITSVGTLTSLNVAGLANLGAVTSLTITGGSPNNVLQTDGFGNLSWAAQTGSATGNITFDASNISTDLADTDIQIIGNGTGNVNVVANSQVWTFNADGNLTIPNAHGNIGTVYNNGIDLIAPVGGYAELASGNLDNFIYVEDSGAYINTDRNGVQYQWEFSTNGNLILPAGGIISDFDAGSGPNSVGTSLNGLEYSQLYWNGNIGNGNPFTGSDLYSWAYVDDTGFHVAYRDYANSLNYIWAFDNNGNLTLPSDLEFYTPPVVGGTGILQDNLPLMISATGLDGRVNIGWSQDEGNIAFMDFNSSPGNVQINTGNLNSTGYIWTFDNVGNLTLPDTTSITAGAEITLEANSTGNISGLQVNGDADANLYAHNNVIIYTDSNGTGNTWTFGADGSTIFPTLDVQRGDNPSGTITGQTLLFGDNTQEAIISTPDGNSTYQNSQRLVINPGAGAPTTGGEGGDIYLWAGRGGNASGSGGDIKIRGGQGGANTSGGAGGAGGYIRIEAGDAASAGAPGYVDINGGNSSIAQGGYVEILGGQGQTIGGDANLKGGYGFDDRGGNVNIWGGGSGNGQANEGNVNIQTGGNTWTFDPSGILTVPGEGIIQSIDDTIILQSVDANSNVYSARLGTNGGLYFATTAYPQGWLDITNNSGNANITAASGTSGAAGKNIYITAGAADQSDFYTTAGGNVNLIGGLGAFNDGGGGGPGGDINITSGLSSDPAGHAGNINISAGTGGWTFDYTGNLTLPEGGIVHETSIPFGGLTGNTIALKPAGGTNADQQLLVYPTAGQDFNHLHLTSGNLYNTELFLGDDNFFVKLANTGNIVINTNDNAGNTYQLNVTPFGEVLTTGDLFLQTPNGVPNNVTDITGSSGSWESNPRTDLATTNGTGAGLTVTVTETGGYASAIAIVNPGSGYANGDTITVTSGSSSATFTISVSNNQWILDTQGELTLPTLSLGSGLNEQTVIRSQRKLIPPFHWSAVISGTTPTVVYTANSVDTTSMKVTMQIQHVGLGMEFFEVFATFTGSDTYYTVGNRVAPPTIDASTVVVGLGVGNAMKITITINSGAATSWVTYDAVEFGIPND